MYIHIELFPGIFVLLVMETSHPTNYMRYMHLANPVDLFHKLANQFQIVTITWLYTIYNLAVNCMNISWYNTIYILFI